MSLYTQLKEHIKPTPKAAISDDEFVLLNRKEYHHSQISPVHAVLMELGVNIGYPYRVLMSFLEQFARMNAGKDFNIIIADQSLLLAGFYIWLRAGGCPKRGRVYAPKGLRPIPIRMSVLGEIIAEFNASTSSSPGEEVSLERSKKYTYVLGHSKTSEQTVFAAEQFMKCENGLLLIKDYAKLDAADEREYLESKGIFPSVTFEGHAFCLRAS